jgi:hypothetical protein
MLTKFLVEHVKGRDDSEDLSVDGRIIMDLMGTGLEGVDWIHLAQDKDWWRALEKTVMTYGSIKGGEFLD